MNKKLINIKRLAVIFVSFSVILWGQNASAVTEKETEAVPELSAHAAALYCVNTGEFLIEKNSSEKMPMASTTKILTSLITLESSAKNNKTVTFTKQMYSEGSSMYLKDGYKLLLSDLATGMMTVSGNDAANAAAVSIAGSIENFSVLMNKKAEEIGMTNSHFVTPSGLDDENHYSTAEDMSKLMAHAIKNRSFAQLTSLKKAQVDFINPKDMRITYGNHNRLLSLYKYCTGGKTGFTKRAGRCLVTCAEKDGIILVAVTLSAPNDWNDHTRMYDYGFSCLTSVPTNSDSFNVKLTGSSIDTVTATPSNTDNIIVKKGEEDKIKTTVHLPMFVYAPVKKGQVVGSIEYKINDKVIAKREIVSQMHCDYIEENKGFFDNAKSFLFNLFNIRSS